MTNEKKLKYLHSLYEQIPAAPCLGVCGDYCCKVPFHVSDFEKELLPGHNFDDSGLCAFLKDGKCTVYEKRPFVCRMYNASLRLGCRKVDGKNLLSDAEVSRLYGEYYTLFWNVDSIKRWDMRQKEEIRKLNDTHGNL